MNKFYVFALPALCLCLSGCFATSSDLGGLQHQLNSVNASVKQIQSDLDKHRAQNEGVNEKLASIDNTISQDLADKDELQSSISQLSARIDDLVSLLSAQLEETKSFRRELLPSQIYNTAYGQYLKKQYSSSVQSFETYIEKYPYGEHVEKALYFKGNGYTELKQYKESAMSYATLMANFPESAYLAAARIRYAQAMLGLDPVKNKQEAVNYYKSVVQDFPSSREAEIAKTKLEELTPKPKPAAKPAQPKPAAKPVAKSSAAAAGTSAVKTSTPAAKPAPKPAVKKSTQPAAAAPAVKPAAKESSAQQGQ